MRTGIIAEKLGMSRLFTDDGRQVAVTLLKASPNVVLEALLPEKHGYTALKVGMGRAKRPDKPTQGYFKKIDLLPQSHIREFRVKEEALLPQGTEISVEHFQPGQYVDITGTTIGKGFAGVLKRHGFGGLRASHGVSASHRSHGSTGNRTYPGRVFKNKRMAGHMGDKRCTQQNLVVHAIDLDRGLLYIKGSVPGSKGSILLVRDAVKRQKV